MSSGSALQALLASIGFAEIPPDAAIEAQLRKLFVYYCSFGDIGASALLGTPLPVPQPCHPSRDPISSPAAFSAEHGYILSYRRPGLHTNPNLCSPALTRR